MNEPRSWRVPIFTGRPHLLSEERFQELRAEAESHVGKPYLGVEAWPDWWEMPKERRQMLAFIMAAGIRALPS